MRELSIVSIRIDGGTQPRVKLNESAIAEYAEAITEGVPLPPVSVFFDGAEHWLADGFHRYWAHKRIGALKVAADVISGTRRDAVLHSVGANASHGLRRTNKDKRRAVETLLRDEEWATWSDREIAKRCEVTHPFVASVRSSLVTVTSEAPSARTYTTKHGTTATMQAGGIVKKSAHDDGQNVPQQSAAATGACGVASTPPSGSVVSDAISDAPTDCFGPSEEEIAASIRDTEEELESLRRVVEADDKVVAALAEAKRFREQARIAEERNRGLMNEKNEAIRAAKMWKAKFEKLERETQRAANDGIDPAVGF